jgi:DNA-binding protein H-NS
MVAPADWRESPITEDAKGIHATKWQGVPSETHMATKSKSYQQILKQIENLKAEAEKARRDEIGGVVARIREAIEHYGLTAADLGLTVKAKPGPKPGGTVKRKKRMAGGAPKPAGVVKYSNGAGGTWGGRGKRPQWLRDALAGGKQLSDFLVK